MKTYRAKFIASAPETSALLPPDLPEVAFVGRSNSGKSTLINTLVGQRGLARVSGKPGRTRAVIFFEIEERFLLVDLPGYGYAKAPKKEQNLWRKLVGGYLSGLRPIQGVVALFDIRRKPDELDQVLLEMLASSGAAWQAVWTKADKLKKSQVPRRCAELDRQLATLQPGIPVSSKTRLGREELLEWIESRVGD
jgi:GTP-binding protein